MPGDIPNTDPLGKRHNNREQQKRRLESPRRLKFAFISVSVGCALALMVPELAIRLFVPPHLWMFRDATDDWVLDTRAGWKQKAWLNVTTRENLENNAWVVHFQTNLDGLSPGSTERAKSPNVLRVIIFGDSTVVGRAVPQDQTIHAHLERLLLQSGTAAEVINAGVQGYSTDQVYVRIQQLTRLYQPDVIIYGLCSNDLGGNVSREAYGLPKPLFEVTSGAGLQEIPPVLPTDGELRSFGSGSAKWLQRSALYRLLLPWTLPVRAHLLNWNERNLLGVTPEFYYRSEALEEVDWSLLTALLRNIDTYAESNGADFYFYASPAAEEVWNPSIRRIVKELNLRESQYDRHALEKRLSTVARSVGIHFIPMIDFFMANEDKGPFHLLPRDPHANPLGYRLQAEVVSQALKESRHRKSSLQPSR